MSIKCLFKKLKLCSEIVANDLLDPNLTCRLHICGYFSEINFKKKNSSVFSFYVESILVVGCGIFW